MFFLFVFCQASDVNLAWLRGRERKQYFRVLKVMGKHSADILCSGVLCSFFI